MRTRPVVLGIALAVLIGCAGLSTVMAADDPHPTFTDLYRWRIYFNLVGRYNWITYLVAADGGPTENGGDHPALDSYPGKEEALFGLHLARVPFAFHLTYYRYLDALPTGIEGTLDWVNFSFEYRF